MAVSVFLAFLAGVLSFATPCVVVLVPSFLAYLGGVNIGELQQQQQGFNRRIFLNTVAYVLGFTVVFSLLGVLLNTALRFASHDIRTWLRVIGGIVIIVFGVMMLGIIKVPWFEREHRIHFKRKAGYLTSFLFGMTFAVAWTPCVGAVLGGIFTLAATQPGMSFALLLTYSLGLSLPFLIVGAFYSKAVAWIRVTAKYSRIISVVLGVLLIIVGILLLTNRYTFLSTTTIFINLV